MNWAPFFLISRGFSAAAGTATVFVVYRLTRKLWGEATALVAALFMALTFIHARDSHFGTTDVTMTLFIVLSVSLLVSAHLTRRRVLFAAAGLAGGLATATKYNGALLVAPLIASYFLNIIDSPGRRLAALVDSRLLWFTVPFAAALGLGVPFVVADVERFWAAMRELSHSMQYRPGHADAGERLAASPDALASLRRDAAAAHHRRRRHGADVSQTAQNRGPAVRVSDSVLRGGRQLRQPVLPLHDPADAVSRRGGGLSGDRSGAPLHAVVARAGARRGRPHPAVSGQHPSVQPGRQRYGRSCPRGAFVCRQRASRRFSGSERLDLRICSARQPILVQWTWDRYRKTFMVKTRRAEGRPDWILVQDSPLPSMTQDAVKGYLAEGYTPVEQFTAFSAAPRRVYDLSGRVLRAVRGVLGRRAARPELHAVQAHRRAGRSMRPLSNPEGPQPRFLNFPWPLTSFALFVGLAVLHTWPLATAPGMLSRNDIADTVLHEWILAWVAHQLVTDPLHLFDANIFHPEPNTLAYSDHLFVQSMIGAPLAWLGGSPVLVHNLVLIAGFALTGWTDALVVARWTGSRAAGILSGSLLAFNAFT